MYAARGPALSPSIRGEARGRQIGVVLVTAAPVEIAELGGAGSRSADRKPYGARTSELELVARAAAFAVDQRGALVTGEADPRILCRARVAGSEADDAAQAGLDAGSRAAIHGSERDPGLSRPTGSATLREGG